jgi:hypothetical protein
VPVVDPTRTASDPLIRGGAVPDAAHLPRAVLDRVLTAVRVRTGVRRYAMRTLESLGHAPLMDPARPVGVRTFEVGLDPVRVLVFGGGLAVGYGVRTRQDAVDGPLATMVAEATGRGVVLENRAVQHVGMQRTAASLGAAGTHTFHVAVWCPSFAEGIGRVRLATWRSELHAMIRELRVEQRVPLVLACMPELGGLHPAALVARPWIQRLNRAIHEVARQWEDVVAVDTEPFAPADAEERTGGAGYFTAVAARIAPAVVSVVRSPVPAR